MKTGFKVSGAGEFPANLVENGVELSTSEDFQKIVTTGYRVVHLTGISPDVAAWAARGWKVEIFLSQVE